MCVLHTSCRVNRIKPITSAIVAGQNFDGLYEANTGRQADRTQANTQVYERDISAERSVIASGDI